MLAAIVLGGCGSDRPTDHTPNHVTAPLHEHIKATGAKSDQMVTVLLSPLAKVGYQGDSEDGLFLVDLYWEVSHTPHVSAKVIAIDSAGKTYERVMTVPIYDPPTCPAATPWQGFTGDGGGFCTMYFHLGTAHPVKVRMVLAAGVGDTVAWTGPF